MDNLDDLDFSPLVQRISNTLLSANIDEALSVSIIKCFKKLCAANVSCYRANMKILEIRRTEPFNYKGISDNEWGARSVGEIRVKQKALINALLANHFDGTKSEAFTWVSDDIVYSVGEMLDRISIEYIKEVYFTNSNEPEKLRLSKNWASKVHLYLLQKLAEVRIKGFYKCVDEQRTYDLSGI